MIRQEFNHSKWPWRTTHIWCTFTFICWSYYYVNLCPNPFQSVSCGCESKFGPFSWSWAGLGCQFANRALFSWCRDKPSGCGCAVSHILSVWEAGLSIGSFCLLLLWDSVSGHTQIRIYLFTRPHSTTLWPILLTVHCLISFSASPAWGGPLKTSSTPVVIDRRSS